MQLDFAISDLATRAAPMARRAARAARLVEQDLSAQDWYDLGLELEVAAPIEARDAYRRALELDAHHADAHVNLGRLLHEQGLVEEAERHYRLALRESPEHATAAFNLGIALEDLGRPADAIDAYRAALATDPRLADAHYNVARLYEKAGKKAAALRHLSSYRRLTGDEWGMALFRVGDAQCRVPDPQRVVHVVREPRRVTELPGAAQLRRELGEEIVQSIHVLFEVGRQLEQDRPELGAELARRFEKVAQRIVDIPEPGDVGDALRCLEHECERRGCGGVPAGDGLRIRHAVEGVVDLDRAQPLGVVLEHLRLGELRRIERPLPLGKVVARRPDVHPHATQTVLMLTNSLSPYSDSSRPYPESLTPPNGSRGSDFTSPLMKTEPTSSSRASCSPRAASLVHTAAPRP